MKVSDKPKTRKEIADELGISYTTFWRLIKKLNISLPSGLIYPLKQEEIHKALFKQTELKDIENK